MKTNHFFFVVAFFVATFFPLIPLYGQSQVTVVENTSGTITPCVPTSNECSESTLQVLSLTVTFPACSEFTIQDVNTTLYDIDSWCSTDVGIVMNENTPLFYTFTNTTNTIIVCDIEIPMDFCSYNFDGNYNLTYVDVDDLTLGDFEIASQILPTWISSTTQFTGSPTPTATGQVEEVYISYSEDTYTRTSEFTQDTNFPLEFLYLDYQSEPEIDVTDVFIEILDNDDVSIFSFDFNPDLDEDQNLLANVNVFVENYSIKITETFEISACSGSLLDDIQNSTAFSLSTCPCFDNSSLESFYQSKNILVEDTENDIEYCFDIESTSACMENFSAVYTLTNPAVDDNPGSGNKQLGWVVLPIDLEGFGYIVEDVDDNVNGQLRIYNDGLDECNAGVISAEINFSNLPGFLNIYSEDDGTPDEFDSHRRIAFDFSVLNYTDFFDVEGVGDAFSRLFGTEDPITFLENGKFSLVFSNLSIDPDSGDLNAISADGAEDVVNSSPIFKGLGPFDSCSSGFLMFQANSFTNNSYYSVYKTMCEFIEFDDSMSPHINIDDDITNNYLDLVSEKINFRNYLYYYTDAQSYDHEIEGVGEDLTVNFNVKFTIPNADWDPWKLRPYGSTEEPIIGCNDHSLGVQLKIPRMLADLCYNDFNEEIALDLIIVDEILDIDTENEYLTINPASENIDNDDFIVTQSCNFRYIDVRLNLIDLETPYPDEPEVELTFPLVIDTWIQVKLTSQSSDCPEIPEGCSYCPPGEGEAEFCIECDDCVGCVDCPGCDDCAVECNICEDECIDCIEFVSGGYFEGDIGMSFYSKCDDCQVEGEEVIKLNLGCDSAPVNYRCGDCEGSTVNFNTIDESSTSTGREFTVLRNTFGYVEEITGNDEYIPSEGLVRSQLELPNAKILDIDAGIPLGINPYRIYEGDEVKIVSWGTFTYVGTETSTQQNNLAFGLQIGGAGELYLPIESGVLTDVTGILKFYSVNDPNTHVDDYPPPILTLALDELDIIEYFGTFGAPIVECDNLDPNAEEEGSETFMMFPFGEGIQDAIDATSLTIDAGYVVKFEGTFPTYSPNNSGISIIDIPIKGSYVSLIGIVDDNNNETVDAYDYCYGIQACDFFETYLYLYETKYEMNPNSSIWRPSQMCTRSYSFKYRSTGPPGDHFPNEFRPAFAIENITVTSPTNSLTMINEYFDSQYYVMKMVGGTSPQYRLDNNPDGPMGNLENVPMGVSNGISFNFDDDTFKMFDHQTPYLEFSIGGLAEVMPNPQIPSPLPSLIDYGLIEEEALTFQVESRNLIENPFSHNDDGMMNDTFDPVMVPFDLDLKTYPICLIATQPSETNVTSTTFDVDNINLELIDIGIGLQFTSSMTMWIRVVDQDYFDVLGIELTGGGGSVTAIQDANDPEIFWFHKPSDDFFPEELTTSNYSHIANEDYLLNRGIEDYGLTFTFELNGCPPDEGDGKTLTIDYRMGIGCGTSDDQSEDAEIPFNLMQQQLCDCTDEDDDYVYMKNMYESYDTEVAWDNGFEGVIIAKLQNEQLVASLTPEIEDECTPNYGITLTVPSAGTAYVSDVSNITFSVEYPEDWDVDPEDLLFEIVIDPIPDSNFEIFYDNETGLYSFSGDEGFVLQVGETVNLLITIPGGNYSTSDIVTTVFATNICGDEITPTNDVITYPFESCSSTYFCKIIPDNSPEPTQEFYGTGNALVNLSSGGYVVAGGINSDEEELNHYVAKFNTNDDFGEFFGDIDNQSFYNQTTNDIIEDGDFLYTIGDVKVGTNGRNIVVAKIAKLDGAISWKKRYNITNNEYGYAGAMISAIGTGFKKLIVVGKNDKYKSPNYNMFALKIDENTGNEENVAFFSTDFTDQNDDVAYDIVALDNNNLVIVGQTHKKQAVALKINQDLVLSSRFVLNESYTCYKSVNKIVDGGVTKIFAMGYIGNESLNVHDMLISDFNDDLNSMVSSINSFRIYQSSEIRSETINDFVIHQENNNHMFYACGTSSGSADLDNTDGFLLKVDQNYSFPIYSKTQYIQEYDELNGITILNDDNLIATGALKIQSTEVLIDDDVDLLLVKADLDLNSCCTELTAIKSDKILLKKTTKIATKNGTIAKKYGGLDILYHSNLIDVCPDLSKQENFNISDFNISNSSLHIVPNPNDGEFEVSLTSPSKVNITKITIYDISGSLIETIDLNPKELSTKVNLNLETYPSGLYILELVLENKLKFTSRVSIMK